MKRKVLFALLAALLIVGVVALAACAPTQEDADAFYADLRAQAEEANADLGAVMAETAKYDYTTSFDIMHNYYNGVSRGTVNELDEDGEPIPGKEGENGWKDGEDGYTWMYETAHLDVVKKGNTITTTATIFLPVNEETYENDDVAPVAYASAKGSVNSETGEFTLEWSKYGGADGKGADADIAAVDASGNAVGVYDMSALLTLWYDMLSDYGDISDKYDAVTTADSGFKIYQDIAQVSFRQVFDLAGEDYGYWHDPAGDLAADFAGENAKLMSRGFDADIAYNWEVISGMKQTRVSVTSTTKNRMKSFEFFVEDIIAYYDETSVMNKQLILYADVYGNTDFVAEIEITE